MHVKILKHTKGEKMQLNLNQVLDQIIKKHKVPTTNTEAFLESVAKIYSKHVSITTGIKGLLEQNSPIANTDSFFINCPNCGSHAMVSTIDCHICGHAFLEQDSKKEAQKQEKTVEAKKEVPKKEKVEAKEKADDDFDFEDELEVKEEKKAIKKKKTTKKKVEAKEKVEDDFDFDEDLEAKEEKKESKKVEAKKENSDSDWEDDFDFGDDTNTDDDFDFDI